MWISNQRLATSLKKDDNIRAADPSGTLLGKQKAYFGPDFGFAETPFYDGEKLETGMVVTGPAIVPLTDTTIVVPPEFTLTKKPYGYFVMDVPV
ncbi:uncharacterized protein Dvar_62240 [Desulfosarcina variabilis str. Montpellier]